MAVKSVPLKRRNPDNPQIKSYNEAVRRGRNSYHVLPREEGWVVKRIGAGSVSGHFERKSDAISHAREKAHRIRSEIFIHSRDGLIRERRSYAD